jgi:hypothetical protein
VYFIPVHLSVFFPLPLIPSLDSPPFTFMSHYYYHHHHCSLTLS